MQDQVNIMRHSLAHILAAAIQELYPEAKFGVGPVVDNGFYYDIELGKNLTIDDLTVIEQKMREIIKADYPIKKTVLKIEDAIKYFESNNQIFKVELLKDLHQYGTTAVKDIDQIQLGADTGVHVEEVGLYTNNTFTDLCRGPHVESTGKVGAFKLTRVSGAYWRGDEKNKQLQRIYGVGFLTKEELNNHLLLLKEAERRDHRKIGKEMDLFAFSDLVGPGLPLYTPKGTILIEELKKALKEIGQKYGMMQVSIPHLAKIGLYQTSGHAQKFSGELFNVESHYDTDFILKPVNCPHHTQIFASKPRSYRDLPMHYAEVTMQYRDEKPGQLGGLQRTRGFMVDDGHVFCRVDQIQAEVARIVSIIKEFYEGMGLWGDHWVSLSVRDTRTPDAYIGSPEDWNIAETMLSEVATEYELDARRMEGEAAIYGPKIDFMFKDALGRETQLATVQLDFAMPKRFELEYTDTDGSAKTPVMIHRAILGSFERFIMLLIEHYAGAFPTWLSPEQVRLIAVNDTTRIVEYADDLKSKFAAVGLRASVDSSAESVGKKIRAAGLSKVPYTIVIGDKELESGMVSPRLRKEHGDYEGEISIDDFVTAVARESMTRAPKSILGK